ncbi:MAG: TraM recognition domain-containing protein, partial [Solirubrobacterales bacterium]
MDRLDAGEPVGRLAVIGAMGWLMQAGAMLVRLAAGGAVGWAQLCIGVPMRIWWWIWRRPLPLFRRLQFAFVPWLVVGVLATPWYFNGELTVDGQRLPWGPRVVRAAANTFVEQERGVGTAALAGLEALASPWEPEVVPVRPLKGRLPRRELQHPLAVIGGQFAVLALVVLVFPMTLVTVLGGPVLIPILLLVRGRVGHTVSGRVLRNVSTRRFAAWRAKADKRKTWFVGASATGQGALTLDPDARLMHTWVVGATGTGKTQSVLLPMLRSDILAGRTAIFIDGKGDRETFEAIASLACQAGREDDLRYFDLRRPGESHSFSPLLHGSANEQVDKIMAALRWDSEYYRTQSKSVLLRLLRALKARAVAYTLADVLAALSNLTALRELASSLDEARRAELEQVVARWKEYQVETSGLRSQLEALLMTDFGELLRSPHPTLDLAEAYRSGAIVYIALPVARFPETAPLVAKLVISDLNSVAGMVQDGELERGFASVVIDEFAAFAMPLFIDLLNKGRSAGMAITISHQSMRGDLAAAERGFVEQIADNTNIKICLRQSADAEYVAGLSGTYKTVMRTEQTMTSLSGQEQTGLGSAREVDEYHVSPNLVRQLEKGHAVFQCHLPHSLDLVRLDFHWSHKA